MFNFYLVATEAIKPQVFALPNRFASLYTALFVSQDTGTQRSNNRISAALSLQQMANEMDNVQPSLAAELRSFASRS